MPTPELMADFHVHSRFSIATGQQADLEHLDLWGRYKGLGVVGTGDCTHPAWLKELAAKLIPAGEGVYHLKPELALPLTLQGPRWQAAPPVHFVLTGEISAIYTQGGRVRKVHLLILLSGLEAAERLSARLARVGNVVADGRPILGLSARQLTELTLEADPQALVIPAHIWTPWFSVLGAKSGFDTLEECFGDLVGEIYALETGLSSDPAMNWRVSGLDRYRLVSNSDAHSPQKLGREANLFTVPPTYPDLARALRTGEGFVGTVEFFPEEGKYHLDGHRKCGVRLTPEASRAAGGLCPECGKPLTLGVMHRVLELADRKAGERPGDFRPFTSLVGLPAVLGQALGTGSGSKKVQRLYFHLLETLGPELNILRHAPLTAVAREGGALVAHALNKMRRGEVHIAAGYDGAYGEITLLTAEERSRLQGQGGFWEVPSLLASPPAAAAAPLVPDPPSAPGPGAARTAPAADPLLAGLNPAQQEAVTHVGPPLIVLAGPGTGKTRALTHRLAYLLNRRLVPPERVLALTFTRQAAGEMTARLRELLPDGQGTARVTVCTFHALGLALMREHGLTGEVVTEEARRALLQDAARRRKAAPGRAERWISRWKQALLTPAQVEGQAEPAEVQAFALYEDLLQSRGLWDYEDLLARPVRLLEAQPALRRAWRDRFRHLVVDEYQDLNEAQYRFFRLLAGPQAEVMVIGDPHQAIYGFRGASPEFVARLREDRPEAVTLSFTETYRLPPPLLAAAARLLPRPEEGPRVSRREGGEPPVLLTARDEREEARLIAREIEHLVGGLTHKALEDSRLRARQAEAGAGFREVAVLFRLHRQAEVVAQALTEAGLPWELAREEVGPEWTGIEPAAEKVKLLTLHAAKGLEFPYVFIAGCEAGLIPLARPGDEAPDLEEERRLFYVGFTRASRRVFLSRARRRTLWGKAQPTRLSPWAALVEPQEASDPGRPPRPRARQRPLFSEPGTPGAKGQR
jgi:DNA helicase-2/ATP-dependent DNA helicase PcrA